MTVTQASRRDMSVSHTVSHTTPTRPDPTRPLSSGCLTPHRRFRYARVGDGLVSATRLDASSDLTTIEHLDFEPSCESDWCHHGHPKAVVLVEEIPCRFCGDVEPDPLDLLCRREDLTMQEALRVIRWLP